MQKSYCEFAKGCPLYQYFSRYGRHKYLTGYCEGDFVTCHRHQLREAGRTVPEMLLPDGTMLLAENRVRTVF